MFRENYVSVMSTDLRAGLWQLREPVIYDGRDRSFIVPQGFGTDFATIPKPLRWLVGRTGSHTLAAVLHDYLVTTGIERDEVSHRDADGIFRRVLREGGTPLILRWIMWCGVRLGSLVAGRRDGWWRDFPLVALIILAAAPIVVVPTLFVLAGLALYAAAEAAVSAPRRIRRRFRRRR